MNTLSNVDSYIGKECMAPIPFYSDRDYWVEWKECLVVDIIDLGSKNKPLCIVSFKNETGEYDPDNTSRAWPQQLRRRKKT